MFTVADLRNIAIQIERNGEDTYRKAAATARNPEKVRTLTWLADEERNHARWLETIGSEKPLTKEQLDMEKMGRTLLQEMVEGNTFLLDPDELDRAETATEVVAVSKAFEQDTIVFYEFLLDLLDDEESIRQMNRIIAEERNHVRVLENMERQKDLGQ